MSETIVLGGRVSKRALPVIQPQAGPSNEALKRLALPQGELAQFYDGEEGVRYIALIELRAGAPRGNHYHKSKEEWIYVASGQLALSVENIDSKEKANVLLAAGDLVKISTGIAHALQIIQPGLAIEFSSTRFDPADTYRYVLE